MLRKLFSVHAPAWVLLAAMVILAATSVVAHTTDIFAPHTFLYYIQPFMAISLALIAWYITRDQSDRVQHRSDKAFLVGSILSVWFVLYFLSGLITTYVHNSLVASPKSIIINIWSFGVVALAIEYARHATILNVGRRNAIWFGVIIAVVLAVQQIDFGLIAETDDIAAYIKLVISDFFPAIFASLLLTYLAIVGGLPAMLVYRLGIVAITILPPIIPRYDWYLQGITLVLLAGGIFIAIDRTRQDKQIPTHRHYRHQSERAYDITSTVSLVVLALFMTGFFPYRPAAIVSNSMKPTFSRGAIVIVQKIHDPMDVQVGDIVKYKRQDKKITHRVVAIDAAADGSGNKVFTTKGDNNQSVDPPVSGSQLIGIVRAQIPYVGYPSAWLSDIAPGKH